MLRQNNDHDCGVAVSKMMLALHHKNVNFLRLKTTKNLNDFLKIKQFCGEYGLELQGRKISSYEDFYKIKTPIIVQTNNNDKYHFLIIKRKGKKYIINDPGFGTYKTTSEQLVKEMTGYFLEVVNPKGSHYHLKEEEMINSPLKRGPLFGFISCHVLSLCMLFLSFMIFNRPETIHYSIILAASSFVFFVLSRHSLIRVNSTYEKTTIPILSKCKETKFQENFYKLQLIKKDLIAPFTNVFTSIITTLLIFVIIGINDYKLLIVAISVVGLEFVFKKIKLRKNDEYRSFEGLIAETGKKEEGRDENLTLINKKSEEFIQKLFFKDILTNVAIFFFVYIVMLINGIYSLNYMLLYLFTFLYLKTNVMTLLDCRKNISDYYNTLNHLDTIAGTKNFMV